MIRTERTYRLQLPNLIYTGVWTPGIFSNISLHTYTNMSYNPTDLKTYRQKYTKVTTTVPPNGVCCRRFNLKIKNKNKNDK